MATIASLASLASVASLASAARAAIRPRPRRDDDDNDEDGANNDRSVITLAARDVPRDEVRLLVVAPTPTPTPTPTRTPMPEIIAPFAELPRLLRAGDLVVVNDAATLPASLRGETCDGAEPIELRLSSPPTGRRLRGVMFGAGDHHTPTELRPSPPRSVAPGARIAFGARRELIATVRERAGRLVVLDADLAGDALWRALYAAGAPVQYAHRADPLPLWSVQTAYASRPWAVEMPSAGRALTWSAILALRAAGIGVATLTHAAGLSSTGDPALDRALPWPERYDIPAATADAIAATHARGGRVIAIGTTVVRALEASGGRAGEGIATLKITAATELAVVDAIVSGLHVPGESHFELLSAFAPPRVLAAALATAARAGMSAHELGDACLVFAHEAASATLAP